MFPWWNKTVTHYIRNVAANGEVTWTRETLNNCYWTYNTDNNRGNGESSVNNSLVCYIPLCEVKVGDILYRGDITTQIDEYTKGARASDFVKANVGNVLTVTEVDRYDSIGNGLNHLCCKGA